MVKEHGNFEIEKEDNIIHTYPHGGFNEFGVIDIRNHILKVADNMESWILFEHPKDRSGLTPEATIEILKSYQIFEKNGCKALFFEICSTWQYAIEKSLGNKLSIPVYYINNTPNFKEKLEEIKNNC